MPLNFIEPADTAEKAASASVQSHLIDTENNSLIITCRYKNVNGGFIVDVNGDFITRSDEMPIINAQGQLMYGITSAHWAAHKGYLYNAVQSNPILSLGKTGTLS